MNSRGRRFREAGLTVVTLIAIVVVQGILAHRFRVFRFFDLPLIYCVYYGFTSNRPARAVFVGSALGLLQDSLSGGLMGTNGLSKTVICFLAASTGLKFNVDQVITRVLALFLFTLGDGLLVTILGLTMGAKGGLLPGGTLVDLMLSGVFNTLLGLMMFGYRDRYRNAA